LFLSIFSPVQGLFFLKSVPSIRSSSLPFQSQTTTRAQMMCSRSPTFISGRETSCHTRSISIDFHNDCNSDCQYTTSHSLSASCPNFPLLPMITPSSKLIRLDTPHRTNECS
jgi:hypothetical protein